MAIISISINEEQKKFLQENKVKPSKVFQKSVEELMKKEDINLKEELRKREVLQKLNSELKEFISLKGLNEEWINFKLEKDNV